MSVYGDYEGGREGGREEGKEGRREGWREGGRTWRLTFPSGSAHRKRPTLLSSIDTPPI